MLEWIPSCLPVAKGEAVGLHRAIRWIQSLGLSHVKFELDCQTAVLDVQQSKDNLSELGVITKACHDLLSSFPNFDVSFTQANSVAHNLAKPTLFLASPMVFI